MHHTDLIKNATPSWLMMACLLLVMGYLSISSVAAAEKVKVSVLTPGANDPLFWNRTVEFAQAVADDLDIELDVKMSENNSYRLKKIGRQLLQSRDNKPDYFISPYWSGVSKGLLNLAKQQGIKTFFISNSIAAKDRSDIGAPRSFFTNWVGHSYTDDIKAGFDLGGILVEAAKKHHKQVNILAVGGQDIAISAVDRDRFIGLQQRIATLNNVKLVKKVLSDWNSEVATKVVSDTLALHPEINTIWCVSDAAAIGSLNAIVDTKKVLGKDIVVGGIDWSLSAIDLVQEGQVHVTLGGNFMELGWALILIHDYHHGFDFIEVLGGRVDFQLLPITKATPANTLQKWRASSWSDIDFKRFSRKYNPDFDYNDLSPALLGQ